LRKLLIQLDKELLAKLMLLPEDISIENILPNYEDGTRTMTMVLASESNLQLPESKREGFIEAGHLDYCVEEDWIELDGIHVGSWRSDD
jgi:hypothetical protein